MNLPSELEDEIQLEIICRSCLTNKGEMKSLFGACLDDMFRKVAEVQVEVSDGLPDRLCFQCVLQVSRAFRFKQQCQRSDATLRSYIERKNMNIDIKGEPLATTAELIPSSSCFFLLQPPSSLNIPSENQIELECTEGENDVPLRQLKDSFELLSEHHIESELVLRDDVPLTNQIFNDSMEQIEDVEGNKNDEQLEKTSKIQACPKEQSASSFQCNICHKAFNRKQILRRHLKIHDPKKPHVCKDCGMSFTESSNLTKHQKKHTGELRNIAGKPNLCTVCGKAFKWASSLSKHMNHHTKRKVLNCPHCPKYYLERQTLKLHLRTHTGERPFVCNICEKAFTQMCNLEKHLRIHTGEKPFVCPICDKRFTQSSYVAIHMRSHTGEKPYMCNECGKCFAGSNTLAMHKRTHTGERPYCCNICGKTFARLETATVHQRTHTGEKPHYCTICNRSFISSSHLSNHKRTHANRKTYECSICQKSFPDNNSLKTHIKSQCTETPAGDISEKGFSSTEDQLVHETIFVINARDTNHMTVEK